MSFFLTSTANSQSKVLSSFIPTLTVHSSLVPKTTFDCFLICFLHTNHEALRNKMKNNWRANPAVTLLEILRCLSISVSMKTIILKRTCKVYMIRHSPSFCALSLTAFLFVLWSVFQQNLVSFFLQNWCIPYI